jgi:hypothetical protein
MIDAMWKLIDPKSHEASAAQTFQAITDVKDIGKAAGGWNAVGDFGQTVAGRPTQNYLQPAVQQPVQQAAAQWVQADEAGYLFFWEPTNQYWDAYYQLYYDPASSLYYDANNNRETHLHSNRRLLCRQRCSWWSLSKISDY